MRKLSLVIAFAGAATPSLAQDVCVAPPPVGDPCMVGHWVGESNVAERIRESLQANVPKSMMRDIEAGVSPVLGVSVYADGFYHTLPIHHGTDFVDTHRLTGEATLVELDIAIPTQVGYVHGHNGQITFCDAGSPPAMFGAHVDGTVLAAPLESGSYGYVPTITYSCAGSSLNMTVTLPPPINHVDYFLRKVPADAFDENIIRLQEAARALAGE